MLNSIRFMCGICFLCLGVSVVQATENPLSVHILNLQTGQPTSGVTVNLERKSPDGWHLVASGVTDAQGRIRALLPESKKFVTGEYRVVFRTGEYFSKNNMATFFPEIPVPFIVDRADQHYHIPLLLSPYGYSTYRGN